ncbi:hypothetical protein BDZ89DRAFT_961559 [Hymenopellis radicata]|nr:hypothetical protein BDZ89DRAFT_961559 [Hymenopellis radicata]
MASLLLKPVSLSRVNVVAVRSRMFSTSRVILNEVGAPPVQKHYSRKPVGGFAEGRIVGFLFGFSLASSYAAYHLLDEFKQASAALQVSVEKLQQSTEMAWIPVTAHVRRIEAVEKDLKALTAASASKDDISKVRAELKKHYEVLHTEFLDLRTHVWGMQQDLHSLSKKESTSVRV